MTNMMSSKDNNYDPLRKPCRLIISLISLSYVFTGAYISSVNLYRIANNAAYNYGIRISILLKFEITVKFTILHAPISLVFSC